MEGCDALARACASAPTRAAMSHPRSRWARLPTAPRHSRAPTRESMPLLSGCARAPGATPAPPTNAPYSLPWLLKPCPEPVEACPEPVEGDPRNTRRWRPWPAGPDLRVNVAKCRRMSHYFDPSTRKPLQFTSEKTSRFGPETRPFWPISVHFRVHKSDNIPLWLRPGEGGGVGRGTGLQAPLPAARRLRPSGCE